jgi:hypothetical protein
MTETLKLALEALEDISVALREDDVLGSDIEMLLNAAATIRVALAQPEERNFCPRCGKRTADPTTIHTCTPPIAAGSQAFYGFPNEPVSTPNAGGKCVTAGETAPITELWAALTAYQPHADTCGHGKSWRKMCEARTKDAAGVAASHAVVYASSTNVAADAAHIVWAGGDLGVAVAKIKSITR